MHRGTFARIDVGEGAANWCRQHAASVADQTQTSQSGHSGAYSYDHY
jgi:hypothetical protein